MEHRLARVSELYVHRHTLQEIGDLVGVSVGQVCHDVKELQRRWRETRGGFDEAKEKELAKLDALEREARAMWELSKSEESRQVEETVGLTDLEGERSPAKGSARKPPPTEPKVTNRRTKTTHNSRAGSAYWWEQQRWCVEQRCKLLGLYPDASVNDARGRGDTFVQINVNGEARSVNAAELHDYFTGKLALPAAPSTPPQGDGP